MWNLDWACYYVASMQSSDKRINLSFLIPSYCDENTIEKTVTEARDIGRKIAAKFEIIVINDASPDNLAAVLTKLLRRIPEMRVITHKENMGYGATIRQLYYAGRYEWLYTTPGDYQIPPSEIMKLLPGIRDADMIIGWRVNREDPASRLRQSMIYNYLLKFLYGLKLHDVNSVRLMKSVIMKNVKLVTYSAFVDAELTITAIARGYQVSEVPIGHRARFGGEETAGGGKLKTILPVIRDMLIFRIRSLFLP